MERWSEEIQSALIVRLKIYTLTYPQNYEPKHFFVGCDYGSCQEITYLQHPLNISQQSCMTYLCSIYTS